MKNFELNSEWIFVLQILLLCLFTFLVLYSAQLLIKKRLKKLQNDIDHYWQESILSAVGFPAALAIITIGFASIIEVVAKHYSLGILGPIQVFRSVCIVVITTWFFLRIISKIEPYLSIQKKYKIDKASADTIVKLLTITIFLSSSLSLLDALGFSIQTVLAFGGLSSVILGLAAKDFIAGLFGTFIIYFDKPFVVGDTIRVNIDKVNTSEGVVEKITWRLTQIRSLDKKTIFIPNSQFSLILVENASRLSHHKLIVYLDIIYNHNIDHIQNIIKEIVNSIHDVDININKNDTMIEVCSLNESSIEVKISIFVRYLKERPRKNKDIKLPIAIAVCRMNNQMGIRFTGKIEG